MLAVLLYANYFREDIIELVCLLSYVLRGAQTDSKRSLQNNGTF